MVPSSCNVAGPENCTVAELSVTSSNVSVALASNAIVPPDTLVLSSNVSVTPDATVMVPEFCSETSSIVRVVVTSGVPPLLMSAASPALGGELKLQLPSVDHVSFAGPCQVSAAGSTVTSIVWAGEVVAELPPMVVVAVTDRSALVSPASSLRSPSAPEATVHVCVVLL